MDQRKNLENALDCDNQVIRILANMKYEFNFVWDRLFRLHESKWYEGLGRFVETYHWWCIWK